MHFLELIYLYSLFLFTLNQYIIYVFYEIYLSYWFKCILKLVDEGKLPANLQPKDMGTVMKLLPRLAFEDCLKEEIESVKLLGEYAGKFISAEVAKLARKIVIGN